MPETTVCAYLVAILSSMQLYPLFDAEHCVCSENQEMVSRRLQ